MMKVLLLSALACLVSATEEPLQFSGNFTTIYLAADIVSVTQENSDFRMLIRDVKFFKNYTLMSMTFYVRKNGKCQLHTVWADKYSYQFCFRISFSDPSNCIKMSKTGFIIGTWVLRNANRHFPHIYSYPPVFGGLPRRPTGFYVFIDFVSKTTILFKALFINSFGNLHWMTAALATGTNLTEEMWKDYVNLTQYYEIPIRNIKNIYEEDACPKWEPR